MTPQQITTYLAFIVQALYGALAFGLLGLASVLWGSETALAWAVVGCGAVVISQSFGMLGVRDNAAWLVVSFGLWLASIGCAALSLIALF